LVAAELAADVWASKGNAAARIMIAIGNQIESSRK
jgi:hypothetical protein